MSNCVLEKLGPSKFVCSKLGPGKIGRRQIRPRQIGPLEHCVAANWAPDLFARQIYPILNTQSILLPYIHLKGRFVVCQGPNLLGPNLHGPNLPGTQFARGPICQELNLLRQFCGAQFAGARLASSSSSSPCVLVL